MYNDKVKEAIVEQGLDAYIIEENPLQPAPVSPEAQKLFKEARIFRARGHDLENQAAVCPARGRRMQLRREAAISHGMADRYEEEANAIAHYGRKGMQWGVRRTKKQLKAAEKAGTSSKKLKKQAKKMTNEELQAHVKRMNLEKQYVSLSKQRNAKTKSTMQRGKSEMAQIAKKSAKKAIERETTNQMSAVLSTAVKKSIAKSARARSLTGVD